jgi:hypothetical protein
MPEIHALVPVSLREAWPDEARDFTPWLAGHLELLGAELALDLEEPQVEATLPGAGRVDILARQAGTDAIVVVENQLEVSDDSHLLRLLGYAAIADANILVWVAQDFTEFYLSILSWLNASDTIDVYAVTVKAYRIGDALAADFRTVVEPPQSRPGTSSPARETMNTHYAEFYRPLVAQLRHSGLHPVGRGGWRGRWRSFQTGYSDAIYVVGLDQGKAEVYLYLNGSNQETIYHDLNRYRDKIDSELDGNALWDQEMDVSWVMLETEATVNGPEDDLEKGRQWMADNLLRLHAAVQPYLEQVMGGSDTGNDDAEDDE